MIVSLSACGRKPRETAVAPPPTVAPSQVDPWRAAARRVEEERNEPAGRKAQVAVPDQLKHYADTRRFLALQIADSRKQKLALPHDFIELIDLIRAGKLVEIEPVGKDYILYGVGGNATDEPFSHFDRESGQNIPLHEYDKEFEEEQNRLADSAREMRLRIAEIEAEHRKTKRRDRKLRSALQAQISDSRKSYSALIKRMELLASFYKNNGKRRLIEREYKALKEFSADFGGQSYELADAASRQKMKVRLLSFLRPEARDILFEIARSYSEKFERPLPVTSLIRPEQYQRLLGETNPNATRADVPPHSTGMAFDIYYYYMTASEQDFLMAEVARLEDEGRVEALRENRNHIHIFAFVEGRPPDERLVVQSMSEMEAKRSPSRASSRSRSKRGAATRPAVARSNKKKAGPQGGAN
jgi:hypothetical protein